MDILVFAAGVFLFSRKHRFLGAIMIIMGALWFALSYFAGMVHHAQAF
jgi:hypothetical protein